MDVPSRPSRSPDQRPKLRVVPGGAAERRLPSDDEIIDAVQRGDQKVAGAL